LQATASWALKQWGGEVIGVTGSAGKTSAKDVIAALLAPSMPVGKTMGNLNNHVGVPLSILRLPGDARVAVLEMGMNHAGEIRALCAIAPPRIGVVTNVGSAHMENFDSIQGVAAAKRELIESLQPGGIAVLNADDPLVSRFREVHPGRTITFGIDSPSDIRASEVRLTDHGVSFRVEGVQFESTLIGRHSVSNILAGLTVAALYGIRPSELTKAVKDLAAPPMRGRRLVHNEVVILDDCYNSNPDAARAMIDVLRDMPAKRRIAVLGEMLELGRWSEPLHRDVGNYVAASGIDVLVGIRGEACHLVDAARQSGLAVNAAFFFPDAPAAGEHLRRMARPGDVILFKGSRGTHVELALERFVARPN
jgi:UDP-N-acetylmuramoyl-tripeptide--D-alanyl-D-alanine ligase